MRAEHSRAMKVLITNMHNFNGGGHVTYIKCLLAGMRGSHDITVATPSTSRMYKQAREFSGVRVIGQKFTLRFVPMLREILRVRRLLRRECFDVAHVNGAADHRYVMLASLGMKHPPAIVWTKHNTKPVNSVGNWLRARLGTSACIAVSDAVAAMLRNSFYSSKPIDVVRLGLDVQRFSSVRPDERLAAREAFFGALPDNVLVLGSVGGTDYEKGWLDLVSAVATLTPELRARVRIIVAGDSPSRACMDALRISGLQKQVLLPGLLEDIRPVLAASDVGFVLSHEEAASYASLECMAAGLPVLVSDVGGLPEHIRDGQDGWVVSKGDVPAISALIQRILNNDCDLQTLGDSGRRRVRDKYALARICQETENVYRAAVQDARQPSIQER